jgi:Domain of unknown function (DUF4265)
MTGQIVTHTNPLRRPSPSFMLQAVLDESAAADPDLEQLWTRRVGEGRFEISCLPFFVYDLAYGDVVRSSSDQGWRIGEVISRSGHGLVRAAVDDPVRGEEFQRSVHAIVAELAMPHEWYNPRYVAVHIAQGTSPEELLARLAELGNLAQVERILC